MEPSTMNRKGRRLSLPPMRLNGPLVSQGGNAGGISEETMTSEDTLDSEDSSDGEIDISLESISLFNNILQDSSSRPRANSWSSTNKLTKNKGRDKRINDRTIDVNHIYVDSEIRIPQTHLKDSVVAEGHGLLKNITSSHGVNKMRFPESRSASRKSASSVSPRYSDMRVPRHSRTQTENMPSDTKDLKHPAGKCDNGEDLDISQEASPRLKTTPRGTTSNKSRRHSTVTPPTTTHAGGISQGHFNSSYQNPQSLPRRRRHSIDNAGMALMPRLSVDQSVEVKTRMAWEQFTKAGDRKSFDASSFHKDPLPQGSSIFQEVIGELHEPPEPAIPEVIVATEPAHGILSSNSVGSNSSRASARRVTFSENLFVS